MYAIIQKNGHQYKVSPGDTLTVDRLTSDEGKSLEISEVLLVVDGDNVEIGKPFVKEAKADLKIIKHLQGEKIRVARYKGKSRYTRVTGFRPQITNVIVQSIKVGKKEFNSEKNKVKSDKSEEIKKKNKLVGSKVK